MQIEKIKTQINKDKYFYLKKRINQKDKEKLWALGEKGIIFEPFQSRIYTHGNLFSHIIGQVDYDNYGVSGIEKFFDKEKPKQVYLAAAKVGGIFANSNFPAEFLFENLKIQSNLIEIAYRKNVKRLFLGVQSSLLLFLPINHLRQLNHQKYF